MPLTLVLDNRGDMLRKILVPMLFLSTRGMVQCIRNNMSIQIGDEENRTIGVLTFKFDYCYVENRPECIACLACINLIALSLIVASHRDEAVTVYGSDRDGNIHFEFRDIGGTVVNSSEVTHTIIDMQLMLSLFEYERGVKMPSGEIRRAFVLLNLPTYAEVPSDLVVVVHVNRQEVRFTARKQSIEVHGWQVFGLQQDEQLVIRITFKHIKSYIAASRFSDTVWLFKSHDAYTPDILVCPIIVEGLMKAVITYFYFNHPIPPIKEN